MKRLWNFLVQLAENLYAAKHAAELAKQRRLKEAIKVMQ